MLKHLVTMVKAPFSCCLLSAAFAASKPFGSSDFSTSPSSLAVEEMPPHQRYPQVPWLAQTSAQNLTSFANLFFGSYFIGK